MKTGRDESARGEPTQRARATERPSETGLAATRQAGALSVAGRLAGFFAITLCLTWLWDDGGGRIAYGRFLKTVAPPLYDLIGFDGARVGAFRQRYVNFVPFVGLLLVTPGLTRRRRILGLLIGLFALFCGHLGLNLTEVGRGRARHLPLVPSLISDTLPFVVWIFVAAPALVRRLLPDSGAGAEAGSVPASERGSRAESESRSAERTQPR
ncbi:MAG: hypothetical protein R3F35_07770 [Myxococcota bacterium]